MRQSFEAQRHIAGESASGVPQQKLSLHNRNSFQQFNEENEIGRENPYFEMQLQHQTSGEDLFPQQTGNFNFNQSEMSDRNMLFKFDSREENAAENKALDAMRKRTSGIGLHRGSSPLDREQHIFTGLNVDDILGERGDGGEVGPVESILREPMDKGIWQHENSFSPSANIAKQDEDKIRILPIDSSGIQGFTRAGNNSDQNQLSTAKESYASFASFRNQTGYNAEHKSVDNFMLRNLVPPSDEIFTKQNEFMQGKGGAENAHPDFSNLAMPNSPNIYQQQRHYSEQILPSQIKYAQPIGNERLMEQPEKMREAYRYQEQFQIYNQGNSIESVQQSPMINQQQYKVPDFSIASISDSRMQIQKALGASPKISAIGSSGASQKLKFPKDTSLINENKQKQGHSISPLLGFSQPQGPIQLQRRQSTQLPEEKKHSPLLTISVNQPQLSHLQPFDSLKSNNAFESPTNNANRGTQGGEGEYNEGKWTDEEHNKFLQGLVKFGKNWNSIQKFIKTRTCPQTRSHAQKFFRKLQKHGYLQGMSTSSDMNIDAVVGNNGEMGAEQMPSDDEMASQREPIPIIRSMSLSQLPIQPQIGKRPRLNSMRSDKTRERASTHELTELERQVIEVLNRYSNGASSLRIAKLDSEQNLAFEALAPSPSATQNQDENMTKPREKSLEQQPQRMSTRSQSPIKQKQNESPNQNEQGPPQQAQHALLPSAEVKQGESHDQTHVAQESKRQRRQPLNFQVPTSPCAVASPPVALETKNLKGANKIAKNNDVSPDLKADESQHPFDQLPTVQTKSTHAGAAVSGKNRSKQNIEEFKISAVPQEIIAKSPKDDEDSALQSPAQPMNKISSRKASEISVPGRKSGKKRQAKQYSFEKLRKYQQNLKYRKIFKTYRFDTEEGRRLYQLQNENSYTSAIGRYYYDESCSRALRSERNADGSYRSADLGDTDARVVVVEEDLKEPIEEQTTEMKLGNMIDIQLIEGQQQTWNLIKINQVESENEQHRQVREFQISEDVVVGGVQQRQHLGSLSVTPRQSNTITPLQQAQQPSSFLQQQQPYQGGMGGVGGAIQNTHFMNQQASNLFGKNMTSNSSFYQNVAPPQSFTPDIFDQSFIAPAMVGELDQRPTTSFMSGSQAPYEYQILNYLQQPQSMIGQGQQPHFNQQQYAHAFANYQIPDNYLTQANRSYMGGPNIQPGTQGGQPSPFGGISLGMEEDQRPAGGYVSDPSESPAQLRKRRESFR